MTHADMFLAMILTNARRADAQALIIAVEPAPCRVGMIACDGESKPFPTPPAEVLRDIIARLEAGERCFEANVHKVEVQDVEIERAPGRLHARINSWSIVTE
jgi:hypothetical protein